jgi:hypothetical protein
MRCSMTIALALFCLLGGRAAADDNIKAVIEKAIKAHGGEQNLSKYQALEQKVKGSVSFQGMELQVSGSLVAQFPDKVREELNLEIMGQNITIVHVFDGKLGWESAMGNTRELGGDELNEMKGNMFENYLGNLVPLLKDKNLTVTLIGDDKVDDKQVIGLKVSAKDQKDIKLYFDKDSGMLLKTERKTLDPSKMEVNSETFYSDYKDFNGVKQPMKQVTKHDGTKFLDLNVTDCKVLEKVDDSNFAKP